MSLVEINTTAHISITMLFFMSTITIIWILLVFFSWKKNGWKKTVRYFLPMMGAALFIEASAVANGRYLYPNYYIYLSVIGGSVPLIILLGWSTNLFLFLSLAKHLVASVFSKITLLRIILISGLTGCIGVCLDLLEDPIAHCNHWWVWTEQTPFVSFFGVPVTNFFDWFIILFFMALATQLIDHASISENRKLLISFLSISYVGVAIYVTHSVLIAVLTAAHLI
ncbi:MAG: carotenoid biosynthesis protein [Candidatus Thermoplasmatota archaeon]